MMLSTLCFVSAGAITETVMGFKNIAQGKSYTTTQIFTLDPPTMDYQRIDGKEVTDGVYGTSEYGTEWICFDSRQAKPAKIILVLGEVRTDRAKINLEFRHAGSDAVTVPASVVYYVSDDGEHYKMLGAATADTDKLNPDYSYVSDEDFSARYIKASMTHAGNGIFLFVSEMEVCIRAEIEQEVPEEDVSPIEFTGTAKAYRTEENDLYGAFGNQTVEEFSRIFPQGLDRLTVTDKNGKEKSPSDMIASGDTVKKNYGETEIDKLNVVVLGDVNCDGKINTADYTMMKRHVLTTYELKDVALKAGKVNGGREITTADYMKLKRFVLGTYDMFAQFGKEAPLYDKKMTFTMKSKNLYQMDCEYKGKPYRQTFDHKDWGTWNIGTMYYDGNAMAGGGTDWEYVFRAGKTAGYNVFSGGNHGNENLVSFEVFDGETGEKKDMKPGDSFKTKSVKLVEHTQLHWGNANDYYAEVTRTYYVYGPKITVDNDFHFVKDCYMYLSYTCMFPIFKDYGRHSLAHHIDGTTHEFYTTDGTVYPEYGNNYDDRYAADRVTFWGDKHPDWKFDVSIATPKDSTDNFKNERKVMLWDMNRGADKLYFSKYEETVPTLEAKGHNFGTSSTWEFYVDDRK